MRETFTGANAPTTPTGNRAGDPLPSFQGAKKKPVQPSSGAAFHAHPWPSTRERASTSTP
ncbi:MAG: hypothetical protein MUF64_03775 [Polyangiaceae bacterium]|nr:hypothetical protein [Polyangiaceae bacterium]